MFPPHFTTLHYVFLLLSIFPIHFSIFQYLPSVLPKFFSTNFSKRSTTFWLTSLSTTFYQFPTFQHYLSLSTSSLHFIPTAIASFGHIPQFSPRTIVFAKYPIMFYSFLLLSTNFYRLFTKSYHFSTTGFHLSTLSIMLNMYITFHHY